tara:strand:+ start:65 stop:316 length:252 start_codon:yes stop_codon:yes gene_type:complete
MNKIIMTLGVASSLLTSPVEKDGTEVYSSTQLVYAMNNIEDMKEWIIQDIENEKIDSEFAEFYFETLDETHGFILDFYNKQCK